VEWLLLAISLLMVVACALFVAAEFSFITVDRAAVEESAAAGSRRSRGVLRALRTLSTQLSGAQLGITLTNLIIGFLAEPAIAALLEEPLTAWGLPADVVPGISLAIGLIIATTITMVFGELVPKNLAIADPWRTARAVSGPLRGFTKSTAAVIRILNGSANATVRLMGVEPTEELASARSPEELTALVRRSAQQGALDEQTAELLTRSLAFGDRLARDVLTPRVRVHSVPIEATALDVLDASRDTGYSRFPVVGERGLDDVRGVVHIKHAIGVPRDQRAATSVMSIMSSPVLVPDSIGLDPLLETLRREGLQMAVVIDEYGGGDGIVTIEDLIEEIVGEVADEHDLPQARAQQLNDGAWVISAMLRPDEAHAITNLNLPESEEYETLAGLIADALGRVPALGDEVNVDGVTLRVVRMEGRRVDRVRISATPEDPELTS
jgi:CBS domain containing-hemolysin-like protein